MNVIKSPTQTLTVFLGTSRIEILKPLDITDIKHINDILTENEINYEEREDYFVTFTKNYMINALIVLSCYYDLLVK